MASLPIELRSVEMWRRAHHIHSKHTRPFCEMVARSAKTCKACQEAQRKLSERDYAEPRTIRCFGGLMDTSVPVFVGKRVIGFLETGQVTFQKRSKIRFKEIAKKIVGWGTTANLGRVEDAYFHSLVMPAKQYRAMVRLLETFAQHLALVANEFVLQESESEPPLIRRARAYVDRHQSD